MTCARSMVLFIILLIVIAPSLLLHAEQEMPETVIGSSTTGLTRVVIEEAWHHLGDDYMGNFHNPSPEGLTWEESFSLTSFSASSAYVTFEAVSLNIDDLMVNGQFVAIPVVSNWANATKDEIYRNYLIALPAAAFREGENTIGFNSLLADSGNYDDFEFGRLVLYLQ